MRNDFVDDAILLGLRRRHVVVTLSVARNHLEILPGIRRENLVQLIACLQNLLGDSVSCPWAPPEGW